MRAKQRLKRAHFPPLTASKSTHIHTYKQLQSALLHFNKPAFITIDRVIYSLNILCGRKKETLLSEKSPSGQKNFINKHVAESKGQTTMWLFLEWKLPNVSAFMIRRPWWAPSDRALKRSDCERSSEVVLQKRRTLHGNGFK